MASAREKELAKALRRERELFERIFDTVPLMMTVYEPNTNVLRINRAFERLIGWSSSELASVSLMEQVYPDPEYREKAREYMQACRPEWRDFRVRTRSGDVIESSWTNVRLSDDRQLGIGIDITERNRSEEQLRRSEEALRQADRLKDEFLAVLAHELRNPLAPICTAVEILRSTHGARASAMLLSPQRGTDHALAILDRQLGLMVRLVDDLLDVSRISTGKIDLQRRQVDLNGILQNALAGCRPLMEEKLQRVAVELCSGPSLLADGDPIRLEQVFANLLQNAAKFTPPGGAIVVATGRDGDEAIVRVRDTGVGIPANALPHVFDMFAQAHRSVDQAHGGLGIGLCLVKRLVEMHGGRVTASSAGVGQGSEFVVRLPPPTRTGEHATAPTETLVTFTRDSEARYPLDEKRRVLVVDDNVDAAETLAELFASWGHDVLVAHDGQAAIELAASRPFDFVVMDLGMPGMSGYAAAQAIRANPHLGGVVLIAVTGWGEKDARRRSAEAGFDHHLVKPPDLAVLRRILAGTEDASSKT